MKKLVLTILAMSQVSISAVNPYYYQKATECITRQEEIEKQARIKALAEQMQEEDRQALISLVKDSLTLIGATTYVAAYIAYNTIKFPIMLAYDHKEIGRKLKDLHRGTITGLLGSTIIASLVVCKYLNDIDKQAN